MRMWLLYRFTSSFLIGLYPFDTKHWEAGAWVVDIAFCWLTADFKWHFILSKYICVCIHTQTDTHRDIYTHIQVYFYSMSIVEVSWSGCLIHYILVQYIFHLLLSLVAGKRLWKSSQDMWMFLTLKQVHVDGPKSASHTGRACCMESAEWWACSYPCSWGAPMRPLCSIVHHCLLGWAEDETEGHGEDLALPLSPCWTIECTGVTLWNLGSHDWWSADLPCPELFLLVTLCTLET